MKREHVGPSRRTVVLTSSGAALVLAGLVVVPWWLLGESATELPVWIEAMATAMAFLAAAIAATYAAGAFQLESQRERRWEETQSRVQAERVAVWFERQRVLNHSACLLANDSPLPIYDVAVWVVLPGPEPGAAGMSLGTELLVKHLQVVPPSRGELPRLQLLGETFEAYGKWSAISAEWRYRQDPGVRVDFTDAAGKRWRRNVNGILEDVPEYRDC